MSIKYPSGTGPRARTPEPVQTPLPPAIGDVSALTANARMNKTEAAYAQLLAAELSRGIIVWWQFESVAFRIGHDCTYRPDFLVMLPDGRLELREIKGFMREDAAVKLRAIREMYPMFGLVIVRKKGTGWEYERR